MIEPKMHKNRAPPCIDIFGLRYQADAGSKIGCPPYVCLKPVNRATTLIACGYFDLSHAIWMPRKPLTQKKKPEKTNLDEASRNSGHMHAL